MSKINAIIEGLDDKSRARYIFKVSKYKDMLMFKYVDEYWDKKGYFFVDNDFNFVKTEYENTPDRYNQVIDGIKLSEFKKCKLNKVYCILVDDYPFGKNKKVEIYKYRAPSYLG